MAQFNLTMLGGAAALFSGTSAPGGNSGRGASGGAGAPGSNGGIISRHDPNSFNYSIHHAPGLVPLHGPGAAGGTSAAINQSLLHLTSKMLGNASYGHNPAMAQAAAAASSSIVNGLLEAGYDLTGNLTPCSLTNDTAGAMVACNYSLSDNASMAPPSHKPGQANPYTTIQLIILAFLAGTTSITTIIGNLIVILSFIIERTIRQPTNYFIASLAVSDLLIGTFSMPFYTVYLLTGKYWPLGEVLCDLWLSVDYTVCLTSIYTVFCITIDRFCSVKIPAKYRAWRTDTKVTGVIALTWVIPILVFFTSIFGWQYFVGRRTVPEGMCYVQYMEDALFNCVLQLGYFWVTLTVMCVLYTGIYKVALDLQKKSEAKQKKMTSLVSMAGQTMSKIGIGMSKHQNNSKMGSKSQYECSDHGNSNNSHKAVDGAPKALEPGNHQGSASYNCSNKQDKDEDRSSSPAFPSDTDQSSQSPKHQSNKPTKASEGNNNSKSKARKNKHGKNKKADKGGKHKNLKETSRLTAAAGGDETRITNIDPTTDTGLSNSAYSETIDNNNAPPPSQSAPIMGNSLINATRPFDMKRGSVGINNVLCSPTSKSPPPGGLNSGGGMMSSNLPHNSVAPLTMETVGNSPSMLNNTEPEMEEAETALLQDHQQQEVPSPSSMENMPSESPPPYPSLFQECSASTGGTPGLSEGEFSFPPPPHGTSCTDSIGGGRGSVRSNDSSNMQSPQSGLREPVDSNIIIPNGEYVCNFSNGYDNNVSTPPPLPPFHQYEARGVIDYPSPTQEQLQQLHQQQLQQSTPLESAYVTQQGVAGVVAHPDLMQGIKYIDQDSLKSPPVSSDNLRLLAASSSESTNMNITSHPSDNRGVCQPPPQQQPSRERDSLVVEEPDSPVWKRRSLVERETRGGANGNSNIVTGNGGNSSCQGLSSKSPPVVVGRNGGRRKNGSRSICDDNSGHAKSQYNNNSAVQNKTNSNSQDSLAAGDAGGDGSNEDESDADEEAGLNNPRRAGVGERTGFPHRPSLAMATAHVQVETRQDSKTISRLAKPDEIQPLNAEDGSGVGYAGSTCGDNGSRGGSGKRSRKAGSPLRGLIKSVGSRKFKRKKSGSSKPEKQLKSKSENRARKALRVITIILGAFVLCWTPWHILSMIIGFCPEEAGCVEPTLYDISYWLCYLNSPINPLCYAFANQQFKKTFIRILKMDWHRT